MTDHCRITHLMLCVNPSILLPLNTCMHAHVPLWLTRLFVAFLWPEKANAACLRHDVFRALNEPQRNNYVSSQRKNTRMEVCRAKEKGGGAQMVWEGVYSRFASLSLSPPLFNRQTDIMYKYINVCACV